MQWNQVTKIGTETLRMLHARILEFEKSGVNREMNADDDMKYCFPP